MYDLLVKNARIYPMTGTADAAPETTLGVSNGKIAALGIPEESHAGEVVDAEGMILLPGLVDCHTHVLYAGDRMAEHSMKLRGAGYAEIARSGGGILSTVAAVRAAGENELVEQTLPRLHALLEEGVTSIEIKSGYGLGLADEMKMLRAVRTLREHVPMDITATFLGAHAVPRDRERKAYLREIVEVMLPAIAEEGLAEMVDIFVESIAFDVDDQKELFEQARKLGFKLRAHTDQLSNMGATRVAAEYGALSCDHLEHITDEDARAMGEHGTIAVLLPGAFYFLKETRKPPVELLRRYNVPIAIATDLNPGSSPVASLLACVHMSALLFGLTPAEALLGVTRNAARALGRVGTIGTIEPGAQANFALWELPSPEFLTYQLGGIKPGMVFFEGQPL